MAEKLSIDESALDRAIDDALKLGATYADVRVEVGVSESVGAENGIVKSVSRSSGTTIGVRSLAGGSWGFASVDVDDPKKIGRLLKETVAQSVRSARAARNGPPVSLSPLGATEKRIKQKIKRQPPGIEGKKEIAREMSTRAAEVNTVVLAATGVGHTKQTRYFWSTDGMKLVHERLHVAGEVYINGREGASSQAYFRSFGAHGGWEYIDDIDPVAFTTGVAKRTRDLVKKATIPKDRETTVVTPSEFNALTVHEVVGHPSEADRVLGGESAWAGRAWWAGKRGSQIASELVTAVSDARTLDQHRGAYGTFEFDDEGVPSQRVVHIEKGILQDQLQSRQTAALTGTKAAGAMRASSASVPPLIRMTNTYFEADPSGPNTLEEAIEDVKDGVLFGHQSIPSIDSIRYRFQINAFEGWKIKNGEVKGLLKNISLIGCTPDYFRSIYRVGGPKTWSLHQIPNCGKGDPMQTMRVGNGGPLMLGIGRVSGGA